MATATAARKNDKKAMTFNNASALYFIINLNAMVST